MKRFLGACLIMLFIICCLTLQNAEAEYQRTRHDIFFEGSAYELHVYKISGRQDGNTMLIIGGMQGDEPGGFLSADLYTDITLERGNLIIIPRANFKSIILFNRGVDGDMNRIFAKRNVESDMDKVVQIIKELMSETDVFLNLHDGWGFHYPEYIDKLRNPYRFGQSIIVDNDQFTCKNGDTIALREMAQSVLEQVNAKIGNKKYFMHYFNTNTDDPSTAFSEMQKTATFFALKRYCIPSFGIETSKNLPSLEMKVLHHNYAVNEFMKVFNIVPEQPRIFLLKPYLKYAIVSVNGEPIIVENDNTLFIDKDDIVKVTHIESNYDRGLSCDVRGRGELNDYRKSIRIKRDTKIVFRKDNVKLGTVAVKIKKDGETKHWVFIVRINGTEKAVIANETLSLSEGDELELVHTFGSNGGKKDFIINFKGFVPRGVVKNTGDDRGVKIPIDRRRFIKRFSSNGAGTMYPVIAGETSHEKARFWVQIEERKKAEALRD